MDIFLLTKNNGSNYMMYSVPGLGGIQDRIG